MYNQDKEIQFEIIRILNEIQPKNYHLEEIFKKDLFENEILDSFGVLELITRIETSFDIVIPTDELTLENLSSIESLSSYLLIKLRKAD